MDPHERRAAVRRRVTAAIAAVLLAAAIGVAANTCGADLGLLLLVAAFALLTAGAGLGVSAVGSAADHPR
ncbi:hypothetical protein ACR8AL_00100 [Clavibacter sepedonicus]|nr:MULTISPECIES: hypothetical protein [Clavibacter]MBD5380521.1 hypothetical protein [Clavibacter sp.]UUK66184.1 hypothetical protein LRE50_02850 [Clavibacter sepedonicus]